MCGGPCAGTIVVAKEEYEAQSDSQLCGQNRVYFANETATNRRIGEIESFDYWIRAVGLHVWHVLSWWRHMAIWNAGGNRNESGLHWTRLGVALRRIARLIVSGLVALRWVALLWRISRVWLLVGIWN